MKSVFSKVPEVTLIFWVIKIIATTLGETGGDAISMSMKLGYLLATGIFAAIFTGCVVAQIRLTAFHPLVYWATIVATTTVGTTLADFADRSLHIGYIGGTLLVFSLLLLSLLAWRLTLGSVAVESIVSTKAEIFYWVTVMFSQTLGTALGDLTATTLGIGYLGGAAIFGAILLVLAVLYYTTNISRVALFWSAFILTRPLGAVLGDFLDKPLQLGGLALSRYSASAVLILIIIVCIALFRQRAARYAH